MYLARTCLLVSLVGACAVADAESESAAGDVAASDVGGATATPPVGQPTGSAAGKAAAGTACGQSDAGQGWFSGSFTPPAGTTLQIELYAKVHEPSFQGVDMVVGLGHGPVDGFTDLATIVRFSPTGVVDARNGGAYQAASAFHFQYDHLYAVRFVVDLATHHYNAYVRTYDTPGPGDLIANNYAFRTEQSATNQLDTLGHGDGLAVGLRADRRPVAGRLSGSAGSRGRRRGGADRASAT
jgi:hypothetical protein